ncbi:MAG: dihydropteridine reductase [Clostridia bacterium]|nr:dihydropteridine reductase [Clostridia bacterium]
MEQNNEEYNYIYVAPTKTEREEIERIRKQYLPIDKRVEKLQKLRELDRKVKDLPTIISLSLGIFGCLTFGFGMAFVLEWGRISLGVVIGVVGVAISIPAYPIYKKTKEQLKKKYGEEILRLSEELLNEEKGK